MLVLHEEVGIHLFNFKSISGNHTETSFVHELSQSITVDEDNALFNTPRIFVGSGTEA